MSMRCAGMSGCVDVLCRNEWLCRCVVQLERVVVLMCQHAAGTSGCVVQLERVVVSMCCAAGTSGCVDVLCSWNEWLQLPIKLSNLPRNAQLALTIWDIEGTFKAVPVGGTCIKLFSKRGSVCHVMSNMSSLRPFLIG